MKSFFSNTVTSKPALASRAAVATPPAPAPGWGSACSTLATRIFDGLQTNDYGSLAGGIFTHSSMFLKVTKCIIAAQLVGTKKEIMTSVKHSVPLFEFGLASNASSYILDLWAPFCGDITLLLVSGIAGGGLRLPVFTAD